MPKINKNIKYKKSTKERISTVKDTLSIAKLGFLRVECKNAQGGTLKGEVREYCSETLSFEIIGAGEEVRLAEVLNGACVYAKKELLFKGVFRINSIVPAGIRTYVEVFLDGVWEEGFLGKKDTFQEGGKGLRPFLKEWKVNHKIEPSYRGIIDDLESSLAGLEQWCMQEESRFLKKDLPRKKTRIEVAKRTVDVVQEMMRETFLKYDEVAASLEPGIVDVHIQYMRERLHPYLLQAPFCHRSYMKPLGYAGDYKMVKMMLSSPWEGASLFAMILNYIFLQTPPVIAHQNRIKHLVGLLEEHAQKAVDEGRKMRVLTLGCGPAHEVVNFIESSPLSEHCTFTLLDFNRETLKFAEQSVLQAGQKAGRKPEVRLVEQSVYSLLSEARRQGDAFPKNHFDLVYCAGLYDYISGRVCQRLTKLFHSLTRPGGNTFVTNVSKENPVPYAMSHMLDWTLFLRDKKEVCSIASPNMQAEFIKDSTGVNYYLKIEKGGDEVKTSRFVKASKAKVPSRASAPLS